MYARAMAAHGEVVTLRRVNTSPTPPTDKLVRARVTGYEPEELVGGIQQGDRKVILLAEDVVGFPTPIKAGGYDQIIAHGKKLTVQSVDDNTRRIGDVLIAYEIRATGG